MHARHVALAALLLSVAARPAIAQAGVYDANLADLQLRVTALRPTDSVVTARGVLRPAPGRQLVLATLAGQSTRTRTVVSTPGLLAAHVGATIVPASAFAILTAPDAEANWVVASPPDTRGRPQLYAVLPPGAVQVLALFEVPSGATELAVAVPQVQAGTTAIQRRRGGR